MKPRRFAYCRPDTVDEALALLAEHGEAACVLAGGQSLIPLLNFRLVDAAVLVDIARIPALGDIREEPDWLEVGAAVTQARLLAHPGLARSMPLLAQALPFVGHLQTRSRGTVCGSLAHADPSAELPLCLATLGGFVVLRSSRGERVLSAGAFQTGALTTARAPDELVAAARFLRAPATAGVSFTEMARRHGDFAIASLAAVAQGDTLRLGVGGVADRPTVREWRGLAEADWPDALNAFAWELGGRDDTHASAHYRRDLVRRLGAASLRKARACAG